MKKHFYAFTRLFRLFIVLMILLFICPDFSYAQLITAVDAGPDVSICQGQSVQLNAVLGSSSAAGCQQQENTSYDCQNCNQSVSGNANANINSGQKVCVQANTSFTGSINLNGGTLIICGNASPKNVIFKSGHIIVLGTATFNNLNMNNSSSSLKNYGTLTLQNFTFKGTFENHGTATKSNNFNNVNPEATFINTGTFTVSNNFNNNSIVTNNGTITVNGDLQNNGSGNFTNNCTVNVIGNFFTGGIFNNNGSLSAGNYTYSWSPSAGLSNPNIKNPVASPSETTSYVVTVSGPNGFLKKDTIVITVGTPPGKPVIMMNSRYRLCEGDVASFSVFDPDPSLLYQWYQNETLISSSINFTTTNEGDISLIAIQNGCQSISSEALPVKYWDNCPHEAKAYSLNSLEIDSSNGQFYLPPMYVYTSSGDSILLDDIQIRRNSPVAGIFHLHFEDLDNNTNINFDDPVAGPARRQLVIQVFRDLSRLLSPTGDISGIPNQYSLPSQLVEIQIISGDYGNTILAGATQYYLESGSGIAFGDIWKVINTGIDPYTNLANTNFTPPNGFFHGEVQVNFNTSINWFTASKGPILPAQTDMYTVLLHEALHMLGLASLINSTGGSTTNIPGKYSLYDTYLSLSGALLNSTACYDPVFTNQNLTPGCGITFNGGNLLNQAIYSPSTWQDGSSLSHFNCAIITSGYLMNKETPPGFTQRTPHPDEAALFCDLMYNLTGQFGDPTDPLSNTATYPVCNGTHPTVSGVNDFRAFNANNTGTAFTVTACSSITLGRNDILANDRAPGSIANLSCVEIISGGGTTSLNISNLTTEGFTYTPPPSFVGQTVIKYRPQRADNGERGNLTYIFINVTPCPLPPCEIGGCNFICNGDFENINNWNAAELTGFSWNDTGNNSPDLYINGCNNFIGCNQPVWARCDGSAIPFPPSAVAGNRYLGIWSNGTLPLGSRSEGIVFELGANQLLPERNYRLSFFAQGTGNCNPTMEIIWADEAPCNNTSLDLCPGFTPVATNQILIASGPQWRKYELDFCVPAGANPVSHVFMRNRPMNQSIPGNQFETYLLFDDVSLTPLTPLAATSTTSNTSICIGTETTINYSVCLDGNCVLTNDDIITLQVNLSPGLLITGGSFTNGLFQIPANTLSPANPCVDLTLALSTNNDIEPSTVELIYLPGGCNNIFQILSNVDLEHCPTACNPPANSDHSIPQGDLGEAGVVTPIDASLPPYNGKVVFNGNYNVRGSLRFTNGTFYMASGTIFNIDQTQSPAAIWWLNPAGTYIHVKDATLMMGGATLQAITPDPNGNTLWASVVVENSTIHTTSCNEVSNVIRDAWIGIVLASGDDFLNTSHYFIENTDFINNGWGVFDVSKGLLDDGEGISNCNFTNAGLGIYLSSWAPFGFTPTTEGVEIINNTFNNTFFGIQTDERVNGVVVESNELHGVIWGIYSQGPQAVINDNIINVSNYQNGHGTGIAGFYGDMDIQNNTITGTTGSVPGEVGIRVGQFTAVGPTIRNNTILGFERGIQDSYGGTGAYSYTNNILTDNENAIFIRSLPFTPPRALGVRCNTFDNSGISWTNYGIFVADGAFLNPLGNSTTPNGNAFTGVPFPMEYNDAGSLAGFEYFRSASPQENISITFNQGFVALASPTPGFQADCSGPPGVISNFRVGANEPMSEEDSVNAAMDSLRYQLGSFRKMKGWQGEILSYFEKKNDLDGIYSYCDSLKGCNLEAYNTFMLYLMNKYDHDKQCGKAHQCADEVLNENPDDKEIQARTTYFNYECRQKHAGHRTFLLPFMPMDAQDSTDLYSVANSETSLSELACMKLRMHNPQISCNAENTYKPDYPDCDPECDRKRKQFLKKGWEKETGFKADKEGGQLSQNIPNPASNETIIPYLIPADSFTSAYITIQNVTRGSEVKRIELTQAGYSAVTVNLDELHAGVYTYSLVVDGIKQDVKRMVVVK